MTSDHYNIVSGGADFLKLILNPSNETRKKILLVRGLLKKGIPLHLAIKRAKLGWKNYYKYAPLIYDDPDILAPLPKTLLRDYRMRLDVDHIRIILDGIAKLKATEVIRRILTSEKEVREKVKRNPGRHWLQICKDLQIKWIHELWLSTL